uniref:Translocation protein SEC62 n=1 Tax=Ditylum brightwellii TaxID=49249 RepID=A0A6U3TY49_9STRA|mmetsp:Transcript_3625/g.5509  ORF Transcript_3625/g.5509 Transcript_3625/m.5509 type:complete len:326 (+) Transcript_3625:114-1091(+)
MTTNGKASAEELTFYEDEENLKKLCNFLRSTEGPPVREAIEMDKRVYYLKGEKLVNFLVEPKKGTKWPAKLPRFQDRQEAIAVCRDLCRLQFMHRSEKQGKGQLTVSRVRDFDESGYFTWMYEGDKTFSHFMTTLLIGGFLFCTCFPIWPNFLKVFVWYLSVSLLLFIFFLITARALLFLFVWILGYDCWFLPNLFDESLGVAESFRPIFSFEKSPPGQFLYRLGVAVGFFSFCWWAVTQPSEFDGFISAQGDFISDLYQGKLLSDMSQQEKEDIDKPKMPSLEDLLKNLDSEDENEDELSEEDQLDSLLDNLMDQEEEIDEDEE